MEFCDKSRHQGNGSYDRQASDDKISYTIRACINIAVGSPDRLGFYSETRGILITVGLYHFLVVSALLFSFGLYAVMTRRNAIGVLLGVELILNSANLNFVAFARYGIFSMDGQLFALFVIILAAAEAAIALAIVLNIFNNFRSINVDEADSLRY